MEEKLKEKLKPLLSAGAYDREDYIYWKEGSDFDCSLFLLSRKQRRERLEKIRILKEAVFSYLDGLKEDIFLVSNFAPREEREDWDEGWLYDIYNIRKNVFYREIIKEANKSKIYLKSTHVIEYKQNKSLSEALFRGNAEYLSKACFCVPELDLAVQPTHHIELMLLSLNKGEAYKELVNSLLSFSDRLGLFKGKD